LSHQGKLETQLDYIAHPDACAWDSTSGNLAIMTLFGVGSTRGDVLIYPHGSGTPKLYESPGQYYYYFGGYDPKGNLFFDGLSSDRSFVLSELPKGAKRAQRLKVSGGTIYFPGMVQWDPKENGLIVGDQACGDEYASCLYLLTVTNDAATITKQTQLQNFSGGQVCDLIQGVKYGNDVAGSDYDFCGSVPSTTYLWPYPAGGAPMAFNSTTDTTPVGAAISP